MAEKIEDWFLRFHEQNDFSKNQIVTPFFKTFLSWPDTNKIPLGFQCIEVEILDKKFFIRKSLVVDVEEIKKKRKYTKRIEFFPK